MTLKFIEAMISLDTIEIHEIPPFNYRKNVDNRVYKWIGAVTLTILLIIISAYVSRSSMKDENNVTSN